MRARGLCEEGREGNRKRLRSQAWPLQFCGACRMSAAHVMRLGVRGGASDQPRNASLPTAPSSNTSFAHRRRPSLRIPTPPTAGALPILLRLRHPIFTASPTWLTGTRSRSPPSRPGKYKQSESRLQLMLTRSLAESWCRLVSLPPPGGTICRDIAVADCNSRVRPQRRQPRCYVARH